jgi:uncharacterized protein
MQSCLYSGTVQHHRFAPVTHQFSYPIRLAYLDLEELQEVSARYLSRSRWGPYVFQRNRHLGPTQQPLDKSVRDLVRERTGLNLDGPIRLLTMLDNFGYYFSPLNLYYCLDTSEALLCVVAEVNNIPWREQHVYVLWAGNRSECGLFEHPKQFHVSPFMAMGLRYQWRVPVPAEQLSVGISAFEGERGLFTASMRLARQPLTRPALRRSLWQFPWMTAQVIAAIYYQAFLLWWKQCPVFTHPQAAAHSPPPHRNLSLKQSLAARLPRPRRSSSEKYSRD